jgi:hypothetical protein
MQRTRYDRWLRGFRERAVLIAVLSTLAQLFSLGASTASDVTAGRKLAEQWVQQLPRGRPYTAAGREHRCSAIFCHCPSELDHANVLAGLSDDVPSSNARPASNPG